MSRSMVARTLVVMLWCLGALVQGEGRGAPPMNPGGAFQAELPVEEGAGPGAVLWRAGDRALARETWMEALGASPALPDAERARLAYNVGLSHAHEEAPLLAAAWFESALGLRPRFESARVNRDIARADAGLEPREDGILGSFTGLFTRGESEWFALLGVLLFLIAALLDAFRGGSWARAPWIALLLMPLFMAPLAAHLLRADGGAAMVVAKGGAPLFGAPEASADRIGRLDAGSRTRVIDQLPGWVKVLDRGEERWTPEDSVVSLLP